MFRNRQPEQTPLALPRWDDSIQQRLLSRLCPEDARESVTVKAMGVAGLAALEAKASEIHLTATEGFEAGILVADLESTTWDAAETVAWINRTDPDLSQPIPHREADATTSDRGDHIGAGYWLLEDSNIIRCGAYEAVGLLRDVASGIEPRGQVFEADALVPAAALRVAHADVDYTWTVRGTPAATEKSAEV